MKLRTLDFLLTAPEQKKYIMQCCDSEHTSTSRRTMPEETWRCCIRSAQTFHNISLVFTHFGGDILYAARILSSVHPDSHSISAAVLSRTVRLGSLVQLEF